uniref:Uncharacterized protein n=1 Tax=Anopheles merus TaxID=30066 RepID=A0A182VHV3_ANOME
MRLRDANHAEQDTILTHIAVPSHESRSPILPALKNAAVWDALMAGCLTWAAWQQPASGQPIKPVSDKAEGEMATENVTERNHATRATIALPLALTLDISITNNLGKADAPDTAIALSYI